MKLSKQERIATVIILIIVVLGVGFFVFIKPAIDTLGVTMTNLDNKQKEFKGIQEKAARKDTLKQQILNAYEEGEHLADMFYPELTSYQSDQLFREFLSKCTANVVVEELTVGNPATGTLAPYLPETENVSYDLKNYALSGVEPSEAEQKYQARMSTLINALGPAQTIGASTIKFTVRAIDQKELLKFADELNNYKVNENGKTVRKAVQLSGVAFSYPDVEKAYKELVDQINEEANVAGDRALREEAGVSVEDLIEESSENGEETEEEEFKPSITDYLFSMDVTATFYSIERMQNPAAQLEAQDAS